MKRRSFLKIVVGLPAIGLSTAVEAKSQHTHKIHIIFDNYKTYELALDQCRHYGMQKWATKLETATNIHGKIHCFVTVTKPFHTDLGNRNTPHAVMYSAAYIQNMTTGEVLKNRYGPVDKQHGFVYY